MARGWGTSSAVGRAASTLGCAFMSVLKPLTWSSFLPESFAPLNFEKAIADSSCMVSLEASLPLALSLSIAPGTLSNSSAVACRKRKHAQCDGGKQRRNRVVCAVQHAACCAR